MVQVLTNLKEKLISNWKNWLAVIVLLIYSYILLAHELLSLVPHLDNEIGTLNLRRVSVGIALASAVVFYFLVSKWHTTRVAFFASMALVSSSIFISTARMASWEVLYFLVIPLLLIVGSWLRKRSDVNKLPLGVSIVSVLAFIPGVWLFIAVGLITLRKRLIRAWQLSTKLSKSLVLAAAAVPIIGLPLAFIREPAYLSIWTGLPNIGKLTPGHLFDNFSGIFLGFFWSGLGDHGRWLTGTPILDIFTAAMLILGVYYYFLGHHPIRKRVLLAFLILSGALVILGGAATLSLMVPLIYIFIAAGIALMIQRWITVFPNNPFARSIGIALIAIAVTGSIYFQTKRYFIVWPQTPETVQTWEERKQ